MVVVNLVWFWFVVVWFCCFMLQQQYCSHIVVVMYEMRVIKVEILSLHFY